MKDSDVDAFIHENVKQFPAKLMADMVGPLA